MNEYPNLPLLTKVEIGGQTMNVNQLPSPLKVHEQMGLVTVSALNGRVLYRAESPEKTLFETRATITPNGDYLLMFPDGQHYNSSYDKVNDLIAMRSKDQGNTWEEPVVAFDIDYSQHGFIPLIPRGSKRIYAFGSQPIREKRSKGQQVYLENTPIGFRYSDDDGYTWSDVKLIEPLNDPGFTGMSVMRMCETDQGTWLIGSHEGDWSFKPLRTRQYILRSEDQGETWEVLPDKRHQGWNVEGFDRMDEGRPINLGGGHVFFMARTPEGHLWSTRSMDDGKTWETPQPTPLVHPDAPPMLFHLSDGKTLAAFHHNRHSDTNYEGISSGYPGVFKDRSEIWVSLSADEGRTWGESRFVFVNALEPTLDHAFRNFQCSYLDLFIDNGILHMFLPHRWQQVLYMTIKEEELWNLPTRADLKK